MLAFDDELRSGKQKQRPAEAIQVVRGGRLPLLLSACHATPHTRLNRTKAAERMTGALVLHLAQALGATAILPLDIQTDDPNFDADPLTPYKRRLVGLLESCRLLIDFHGMQDHWGVDICIGIGDSNPQGQMLRFINELAGRSRQAHFTAAINKPFASIAPCTVAAFARQQGHDALQIELSRRLRERERVAETFSIIEASLRTVIGERD